MIVDTPVINNDNEIDVRKKRWGDTYMNYVMRMLKILDDPETVSNIAEIRTLTFSQCDCLHIVFIPIPSEYYTIKGYSIGILPK
jgi:hypothetical protein